MVQVSILKEHKDLGLHVLLLLRRPPCLENVIPKNEKMYATMNDTISQIPVMARG